MNTLQLEADLAAEYKYKKLPNDISEKYRKIYTDNIPKWLEVDGSQQTLYSSDGTPICDGYIRIVTGDYGAFIEFDKNQIASDFIVPNDQRWRYDEKYKYVKYHWLTVDDNSHIKIYEQINGVSYADYKPGMYYVSPHEVLCKRPI